jgi:hypothetical protein
MSALTEQERASLRAQGRRIEEVEAQLALLGGARPSTRLDRAATVGDGVVALPAAEYGALEQEAAQAAVRGRISSFVPASGAATRLCQALLRAHGGAALSAEDGEQVARVLQHGPALALWPLLHAAGARAGDGASVLGAMFGPNGLGLHQWPKGLVPFHVYGGKTRTAFEEHIVEASSLSTDATGCMRLHFTVAAEHRDRFEATLAALFQVHPGMRSSCIYVTFSVQDPRTDTIAADPAGGPFRDRHGGLVFRPGGHGALLGNLEASGGDVVLIKNIDNVVSDARRAQVVQWRRRLIGALVRHQRQAWQHAAEVEAGQVEPARRFLHEALGVSCAPDPAALRNRLLRPWRVAGMVRNTGQPGGGPFWAHGPDGVSLQIVEAAQVSGEAEQRAVLASATHFNPVELVVGLRGPDGAPLPLNPWVDPTAALVSQKSHEGRSLLALEHPGLWNGGMAGWNSVFVEVPAAIFQPVKTLDDLLRASHGGPLPD